MTETGRFDAATLPQVEAADPEKASWVSANAGSGKTRVLTNRVARLLLIGTPPQRILCLTFTKVAAANMQIRLFEQLGEWSMLPDADLKEKLLDLGENKKHLDAQKLKRARTLFAQALETPGGLKIQTIHAFASAILKRFPVEAGVSPTFQSIEDRAAMRLREEILNHLAETEPRIYEEFAAEADASHLEGLIESINFHRADFSRKHTTERILGEFGLSSAEDHDVTTAIRSLLTANDIRLLRKFVESLLDGSASDQRRVNELEHLDFEEINDDTIHKLARAFLYGPAANAPFSPDRPIATKATIETLPGKVSQWATRYRDRVHTVREQVISIRAAQKTQKLHAFANLFLAQYERRKNQQSLLDFDDLILKTLRLLQNTTVAPWVLFRLDGGVDHILIDEAQDVSPRQWSIVKEIAREFTAGLGARQTKRTVFAVGDEKQSIYGFQGAAPEEFERMRDHFRDNYRNADLPFIENNLQYSFRSSSAILSVVDRVFSHTSGRGFGDGSRHRAFWSNLPGRVDLWPFIHSSKDSSEEAPWHKPILKSSLAESHDRLARGIANRIGCMLETGESIPDGKTFRRIRPGDILILVRRRSQLFRAIINELKSAGLPVAGADRLKLVQDLAIRDLTALLSFIAFPSDDLVLAAVLRSPIFGITEDELFELAHGRGSLSLWTVLQERRSDFSHIVETLEDMLRASEDLRPYELLERMLTLHQARKKLTARLGHEIEEAVDALLQQALTCENGTLSLVGFLDLVADETEIKRQLDQAGDEIRVMTIHGAKGLEAPIIILPDTDDRKKPPLNPIQISNSGIPVWMVNKNVAPKILISVINDEEWRYREEQHRLLYVAMTRAESWLIVCGENKLKSNCWYSRIELALKRANAADQSFNGDTGIAFKQPGLRFSIGEWQDHSEQKSDEVGKRLSVPKWAESLATPPVDPSPKPRSPSKLGGIDPARQGAESADCARLLGNCIHLLLEHLPSIPKGEHEKASHSILKLKAPEASEADRLKAFKSAAGILSREEFQHVFDSISIPEAGITAKLPTLGDAPIHGYIDRLLVENERVRAVDFKSNQFVPDRPEEIPESILRQMGAYHEALAAIYPEKEIEISILWTRAPKLMIVPGQICSDALKRASATS